MELKEFKIQVWPLRSKLLNYARRLGCEADDAEDIVQEALLRLWSKRTGLDQLNSIEAFAMTVTRHLCADRWRNEAEHRSTTLDNLQVTSAEQTPEQRLEHKDEYELIRHIVDALPGLQRIILQMKDVEGYETDEIAAITGCNAEAIRSNLSRARRKVRDTYLKIIQERRTAL